MTPTNDKVDQSGADERATHDRVRKIFSTVEDEILAGQHSNHMGLFTTLRTAVLAILGNAEEQTAQAVASAAPKYADFANGDAAMWTESGKLKSEWNEAAPQQAVAASNPIKGCSVCYGTGIDVAGNACAFNCKPLASTNQPVQDKNQK